jgi:hypothetical protein
MPCIPEPGKSIAMIVMRTFVLVVALAALLPTSPLSVTTSYDAGRLTDPPTTDEPTIGDDPGWTPRPSD